MELPAAYESWNEALVRRFLPPNGESEHAFLVVDDAEVETIGAAERIQTPLNAAVRELAPDGNPVEVALRLGANWANGGRRGSPPFVAFLALCVQAAARMGSEGVASHNYYRWFNELLGRDADSGQPPGFDKCVLLWRALNKWLEEQNGERGAPTARQVGGHAHIGWPLSQALIRRADYRELAPFADWAGLETEGSVQLSDVQAALRVWLREAGSATRLAVLLGRSPAEDEVGLVAARIVATLPGLREILQEDGAHRERPSQQRQALVHLYRTGATWTQAAVQVAWRSDARDDDSEDGAPPRALVNESSPKEVQRDGVWSCVDANGAEVLADGAEIHPVDIDATYRTPPSPVYVFVRGETRGRHGWWVQTDGMGSVGDEVVIVARPEQREAVSEALAACATNATDPVEAPWLPKGWLLFTGAKVVRAASGLLGGRSVGSATEWALNGGIRVRRDTWLHEHPPVLEGAPDVTFSVEDGSGAIVAQVAGGDRLVLEDPGNYRIRPPAGPSRVVTLTTPPWPPHPLAARHPHTLAATPSRLVKISGAAIEGAAELPEPVFLPADHDAVLLGAAPSDFKVVKGVRAGARGARRDRIVEPVADFEVQWILIKKRGRTLRVMPGRPLPSEPYTLPPKSGERAARKAWMKAVLSGGRRRLRGLYPAQREILGQYIAAARRLR